MCNSNAYCDYYYVWYIFLFVLNAFLNINGFNESSTHLARIILQNNIHFFSYKKPTLFKNKNFYTFVTHNVFAYSNTDHLLTPHIAHCQGTLILINTQ